MNPISHLANKKFKDLSIDELIQIVQAYDDENKYFAFDDFLDHYHARRNMTRQGIFEAFENVYTFRYQIKSYFKFWNR